jgi:hypothetical protein
MLGFASNNSEGTKLTENANLTRNFRICTKNPGIKKEAGEDNVSVRRFATAPPTEIGQKKNQNHCMLQPCKLEMLPAVRTVIIKNGTSAIENRITNNNGWPDKKEV